MTDAAGTETVALEECVEHMIGGLWGKPPEEAPADWIKVRVIRGADFRDWNDHKGKTAPLRAIKPSQAGKRLLRDGDLVLEVSGGGPDQPVGRCVLIDRDALSGSKEPLICSNFCRLIRLKEEFDPGYVRAYLERMYVAGALEKFQPQTVNIRNLTVPDFLKGVRLAAPPIADQRRIRETIELVGGQLRNVTERLEHATVATKAFGAARLREIFHASDMDPESGDLTDLPDGWSWMTLADVGTWSTGGTPSRKRADFFEGDIPWVKSGELRDGPVTATGERITQEAVDASSAKLLPKGTVSLALYGATIGRVGILDIEAATNQACANCVPDEAIVDRWFLFHYLRSQRPLLIAAGQGGAQPNLNNTMVRKWPIPVPGLETQKDIVTSIQNADAQVARLQDNIHKSRDHVELLAAASLRRAVSISLS